jgi:hypothetical protein
MSLSDSFLHVIVELSGLSYAAAIYIHNPRCRYVFQGQLHACIRMQYLSRHSSNGKWPPFLQCLSQCLSCTCPTIVSWLAITALVQQCCQCRRNMPQGVSVPQPVTHHANTAQCSVAWPAVGSAPMTVHISQ